MHKVLNFSISLPSSHLFSIDICNPESQGQYKLQLFKNNSPYKSVQLPSHFFFFFFFYKQQSIQVCET